MLRGAIAGGRRCVAAVLVAVGLAAAPSAPAMATPAGGAPLPVPYNFFATLPPALSNPDGETPGLNDWSCRPSAAHPNPVVLVHGFFGAANTNWATYGPLLRNEGYCAFALTYGVVAGAPYPFTKLGGFASIKDVSVVQLDAFVDRVLAATAAGSVDLIGHSEGTVVDAWYLKSGIGRGKVDRVVALAGAYNGSDPTFGLYRPGGRTMTYGPCGACSELPTGSAFLRELNAGGSPYVDGVAYTNIATRYDEAIIPYTSGLAPPGRGQTVRNIVVQDSCGFDLSEHAGIAASKRASVMVLNALDPARPRPVPCETALPFTGSRP